MTFRTRSTLIGAGFCPVETGDTPGGPADSRMIAFGEQATSGRTNRGPAALAENTDALRCWYTCGPTGSGSDYEGTNAVEDALDDISGPAILYVRTGVYAFTGSIDISESVSIVGEGIDAVGLDFSAGAYLLTISAHDVFIENVAMTFQGASTGITVTGDDVQLRNCNINYGFLWFNGADRCVGENLHVTSASGDAGITLTSSTKCSFNRVQSTAQLNYALLYGAGCEASFTDCEFISTSKCAGCPTSVSTSLTFTNCVFRNNGTTWYYDTFIEFDTVVLPNATPERGVRLNNCKMYDVWCRGYSSAAPPAGTGIPVIRLIGVDASNLLIDRTGIAADVQDGATLLVKNSQIKRLQLRYENPASHTVDETESNGLIEVLDDSIIEDLYIYDFGGAIDRPLVYLQGQDTFIVGLGDATAGKAVVRNMKLRTSATDWRTTGSSGPICLVARLAGDALLSGLEFNSGSSPSSSVISKSLVYLDGHHNVLEDSRFYVDQTSANRLYSIVGVDSQYSAIRNCRFYIIPYHDGSDYPRAHILGYPGSMCVHIRDCILIYAGLKGHDVSYNSYPIYTEGYLWKVTDNHIQAQLDGEGDHYLITFAATEVDLSGNVGPGGGAIAHGNTLQDIAAHATPAIFVGGDGTMPGADDNLFYATTVPVLPL